MPTKQDTNDAWEDCPSGELSRMVQRIDSAKKRTRTKQLFGNAVLSMVVMAGGVFVLGMMLGPQGNDFGGITCAECKSHFESYHDHLTGARSFDDVGLAKSIQIHLDNCKLCRNLFNEQYPNVLDSDSVTALRTMQSRLPVFAVASRPLLY